AGSAQAGASQCYGSASRGRLEGGAKLPLHGGNFAADGSTAALAGRTYVHSRVAEIVLDAFTVLRQAEPSIMYGYGTSCIGPRSGAVPASRW
ncbi:MAG TPA: hypothetical protein VJN44_19700, partial [Roseateles sp.]|nr:hypothetical protein [Roseateles sp.]